MKKRTFRIICNPKSKQPWRWVCLANNNKLVYHGESHPTKGNAIRAAKTEMGFMKRGVCVLDEGVH